MVTIKVRKRYGAATIESRVTAESVERAVQLAGPGASIVFPLDPQTFFAAPDAPEDIATSITEVRPEVPALAGTPA